VRSRHGPRHCNPNESGNTPLLRKVSGKVPRIGTPASAGKAGSQETCLPTIEQRSSGVWGAVNGLNRLQSVVLSGAHRFLHTEFPTFPNSSGGRLPKGCESALLLAIACET